MTAFTVMPRSVGTGALGWTPTNVPPSRTNARPSCWSTAPSSTASYAARSASAVKSAPVERTNSSSLGRPSPVTAQPADLASATAYPPTAPPAPVTSRVRPSGSPSRSTAWAAVRELSGMDAASTGSSPSGTTATASASSSTRSAWARFSPTMASSTPATTSPTAIVVTWSPTSSTRPETSQPRPRRSPALTAPRPASVATKTSTGFTAAARVWMSTWPGPACRSGTSTTWGSSWPGREWTERMGCLLGWDGLVTGVSSTIGVLLPNGKQAP